ncbi:MAG TPA: hypothetical protein VGS11_04435 [Candidatus Bathyarchaeia archaeon]|nr:hypothetical protein [Candidatus Bathyarchaeia archaeon]
MKPLQRAWVLWVGVFLIALGIFFFGTTNTYYQSLATAIPLYIAGGILIAIGSTLVVDQLGDLSNRKKPTSS